MGNIINPLKKKSVIGMIHVKALPGTPKNNNSVKEIVQQALQEAMLYKSVGVDAIMLENMHDVPYLNSNVGPEITADVSIVETAHAAKFFLSDGVILTGESTGSSVSIDELRALKASIDLPILIGSGITVDNLEKYFPYADAFIIGSHFKKEGYWENPIDYDRVAKFMSKRDSL